MKIPVSYIVNIQECDPGYLRGECQILGVWFHCTFIEVYMRGGVQETKGNWVHGDLAPHIFEGIKRLDEVALRTVRVPGREGNWVLVIQPFGV